MTTHEVMVLCDCENVEQCRMELYVSDVRIAYEHNAQIIAAVDKLMTERYQARMLYAGMLTTT